MTLQAGTPIDVTELKNMRIFRVMSLTGGDPIYLMVYKGEIYWLSEGICEMKDSGGSP